jgi:hypothetical protein
MHIQLNVTSAMGMYNTAFSTGVFVRTSVTGALTWLVQKQTSFFFLIAQLILRHTGYTKTRTTRTKHEHSGFNCKPYGLKGRNVIII